MSVLVGAKHAANAVARKYKLLSRPSKWVLICGCKCQSKSHYILSRVWTHPFLHWVRLKPDEVPNWLGNVCFSVKPSTSRCDATSEEKLNLRPKTFYESY